MASRALSCVLLSLSLAAGWMMLGCTDCDQQGCDAFEAPVERGGVGTGLVGVAALQSDAVKYGCFECPLSTGTLYVWTSATPIESVVDAGDVVMTEPTHIVDIDGRYELELPPGNVLVCRSGDTITYSCAPLVLGDGDVATASVKAHFGFSELRVLAPGATTPANPWPVDGPSWDMT